MSRASGLQGGAALVVVTLATAAVVVTAAMFLTAWLGVVNIGASDGHPWIVEKALAFGMRRSVVANAPDIEPPPLDDPDLVRLGAAHFEGGCAICHAAPGVSSNIAFRQMLPAPPDLKEKVDDWSDQELFFIVQNGIKYAGMPAWPAISRHDEIWSVVAFLRVLPSLDEASYRALAFKSLPLLERSDEETILEGSARPGPAACGRCHEWSDTPTTSALVPRLTGQRSEYLAASLQAYRVAARRSGVMQLVAGMLSDAEIESLADYYAGAPGPASADASGPQAEAISRGEEIARVGLPDQGAPPCLSCHGEAALPGYPSLDGQHERYIRQQLSLWRDGVRGEDGQEALMTPVARALSDEQVDDVAAYFASLEVER